jgi:hypothetical protein
MTNGQDEKFDEKDREKREEKSPEEKSSEEKWQRDPLSAVIWALILIWAGLVFLMDNLGILDSIQTSGGIIPGVDIEVDLGPWAIILTGAGVIVLLEALIRVLVPAYRRPVGGTIIFGFILIGIGLGNLLNWSLVFPLILIGLGLSIILRGFMRSKS